MIITEKLSKVPPLLRSKKWQWLQRMKLANLLINRSLYPVPAEGVDPSVRVFDVDLGEPDWTRMMAMPGMDRHKSEGYPHTKALEYLASIALLDLTDGKRLLDAASGYEAEFARLVGRYTGSRLTCWAQDGNPHEPITEEGGEIRFITGSIDRIPLPDASLDAISCHHSFEHFAGDIDVRFLGECLRLLAVGGRLAITPLFLANEYAEITNLPDLKLGDPAARLFFDPTATFPGWGPYEGFARTYDRETFRGRILASIPPNFRVSVANIRYEGRSAPDMARTPYQPTLNAAMKSLLVERIA